SCRATATLFDPFGTYSPLPLSILAEAAVAEMPVYPSPANVYLPAKGRRLLAFSDSRQEAARLGPRLTTQHDEQVTRSLLVELPDNVPSPEAVRELETVLQEDEKRLAAKPSLRPMLEPQIRHLRAAVAAARQGGRMDYWEAQVRDSAMLAELLDADSGEK